MRFLMYLQAIFSAYVNYTVNPHESAAYNSHAKILQTARWLASLAKNRNISTYLALYYAEVVSIVAE